MTQQLHCASCGKPMVFKGEDASGGMRYGCKPCRIDATYREDSSSIHMTARLGLGRMQKSATEGMKDDLFKLSENLNDTEANFEQVAEVLRQMGMDAEVVATGGGIDCVLVKTPRHSLYFGTADDMWGATIHSRTSKNFPNDEEFTGDDVWTTVSSYETDAKFVAEAIKEATDKFEAVKTSKLEEVSGPHAKFALIKELVAPPYNLNPEPLKTMSVVELINTALEANQHIQMANPPTSPAWQSASKRIYELAEQLTGKKPQDARG